MNTEELVRQMESYISESPRFFADVLRQFADRPYRDVLLAWSAIREKDILRRDEEGRYVIDHVKNG
mgnify:CR=1 FL=1